MRVRRKRKDVNVAEEAMDGKLEKAGYSELG
jgi:hypothetical protein